MKRKTALEVRQTALSMGLQVGAEVRIASQIMLKTGCYYTKKIKYGVVLALYPHHFICDVEGYRVSFRYNEVVGNESTQIAIL